MVLSSELEGVTKLSVTDPTFSTRSAGVLRAPNSTKAYRVDNFGAAVQ